MPDFGALRERMIERDLYGRGIRDQRLLAAFRAVPRELFVPPNLAHRAYDDEPLPIECGQTISQPFIVARMIALASVHPADRLLEVGAGSGYAAAILAHLAASVVSIERHGELAALARSRAVRLGLSNLTIVHGDGSAGWPAGAPYDAILAAAAAVRVPPAWVEQLTPAGRIVMPRGEPGEVQTLVLLTREGERRLDPVRFVPLLPGAA